MPFRDVEEFADEVFDVGSEYVHPPGQIVVKHLRRNGGDQSDGGGYEGLGDAGRDGLDARGMRRR